MTAVTSPIIVSNVAQCQKDHKLVRTERRTAYGPPWPFTSPRRSSMLPCAASSRSVHSKSCVTARSSRRQKQAVYGKPKSARNCGSTETRGSPAEHSVPIITSMNGVAGFSPTSPVYVACGGEHRGPQVRSVHDPPPRRGRPPRLAGAVVPAGGPHSLGDYSQGSASAVQSAHRWLVLYLNPVADSDCRTHRDVVLRARSWPVSIPIYRLSSPSSSWWPTASRTGSHLRANLSLDEICFRTHIVDIWYSAE